MDVNRNQKKKSSEKLFLHLERLYQDQLAGYAGNVAVTMSDVAVTCRHPLSTHISVARCGAGNGILEEYLLHLYS